MATFGYLVYLVRAGVTRHPEQLYRLNEVGMNDEDLLDFLQSHLKGLGKSYHPVSKTAEGFRIKELKRRGRSLWVTINVGPAGSPGETYDLDTQASTVTTERQALLSNLRALFVVPENSYYGLLFVERIGRRHLKELLSTIAVQPASVSCGALVRLEGFAELKDWERELSQLQVLRVSESLVRRSRSDDASTADDTLVTVSAEGGRVHRLSDRLKGLFNDRVRNRDQRLDTMASISDLAERKREASSEDAFTVQDEEELKQLQQMLRDLNPAKQDPDEAVLDLVDEVVPVDRAEYEHKRFDITLGDERPQRSIVIERNNLPQFIYELGGRLVDTSLRGAWVHHAETIMSALGVQLPRDWSRK